MKKCKKCGAVMIVNNNIVFTSNPPQYQLYCPECGHIEYEYYEEITLQDLGNHIVCPDCEQKDQQIAELKKQLALTEKALGLACERIAETDKHKCKVCYSYGDDACIGYKPMCCEYIKKHFEWKAEKELSDGI